VARIAALHLGLANVVHISGTGRSGYRGDYLHTNNRIITRNTLAAVSAVLYQ
jgi:hypothetical protein